MARGDIVIIVLLVAGGICLIASIWLGIGGWQGIIQAVHNIRRLLS